MTGSNDSFAGCITDVTQNGNVLNFAKYTDKLGEILGKCVLDETVGSETEVHIGTYLMKLYINLFNEYTIFSSAFASDSRSGLREDESPSHKYRGPLLSR